MNRKTEEQPLEPPSPLLASQFIDEKLSTSHYQAFLLRLWRVGNEEQEQPTWRLMLEEVHSHQRHYFATLIELNNFLRTLIRK